MTKLRFVGVDPGFANLGFCVLDLNASGSSELIYTRVVGTQKGKTSAKLEDEKRRLEEIEDCFLTLLNDYQPDVLVIEEPGKCLMKRGKMWVTNGATLRTSCLAWGALHGISRARGIYCVKVGAQEIKKTLCNAKGASKTDVEEAVKKLYPSYTGWPTSKKVEHVADAVGAAVTAFTDPIVMIMRRRFETGVATC